MAHSVVNRINPGIDEMIDYICKPYRFTIGFAAYYLMLIYSVASLLLIYSLISSTERPLSGVIRALSFLALSLAGTVLSYYWILMSQRYKDTSIFRMREYACLISIRKDIMCFISGVTFRRCMFFIAVIHIGSYLPRKN